MMEKHCAVHCRADIHLFPVLICAIQGLSRLFPKAVSALYQTRPIKLAGHLISFSQSLQDALEKPNFHLYFKVRFDGLQIARDSICATEMSHAIVNLISR